MTEPQVRAWRVHDTGLVAVPSRFRRLGGLVRHLQGQGAAWPARVELTVVDGELRAHAAGDPLGAWPVAEVSATRLGGGPPVSFVLEVPGAAHLLAAASGPAVEALLAALAPAAGS